LQDCLKEAVLLNVLVSLGNEEPPRECMAGLDVTVRWEMSTQDNQPVPEPENEDQQHRPPTEMGAVVNRKSSCKETFDRLPFTGTTEKMRYTWPKGASSSRKKVERNRKTSPT
jgi:hypothetical protein